MTSVSASSSKLVLVCCLFFAGCAAETFSEPFQIIQPSPSGGIETNLDGLAKLASIEVPIALLPVVGEFHSGKSFLLNSLNEVSKLSTRCTVLCV